MKNLSLKTCLRFGFGVSLLSTKVFGSWVMRTMSVFLASSYLNECVCVSNMGVGQSCYGVNRAPLLAFCAKRLTSVCLGRAATPWYPQPLTDLRSVLQDSCVGINQSVCVSVLLSGRCFCVYRVSHWISWQRESVSVCLPTNWIYGGLPGCRDVHGNRSCWETSW